MKIFAKSPYISLSEDGREVIIKRFDTPRPWSNYLTNGDYTAIVTQTGAGFSFHIDSFYNQILFAGKLDLIEPLPGRYLYLRDNETGEYWNPTVAPAMQEPDAFEARHAPGYSIINTVARGIETSITYFVPLDKDEEKWIISVTNRGINKRTLSLYSYCEIVLGSAVFHRFGPIDYNLFNQVSWKDGVLVIDRTRSQGMDGKFSEWPYSFYAYATMEPIGYDLSKDSFLGRCRSVHNPETVSGGHFKQNLSIGTQGIVSFGWNIELEPGQSETLALTLGVIKKGANAPVDKNLLTAEARFQHTKDYWQSLLETSTINTPDTALNAETNYWIKYQSLINALTWRTFISLYGCSGGPSFRNVATDLYGINSILPGKAKETIIRLAQYIKKDGMPSGMTPRIELLYKGEEADKSDFLLWFVFVVNDYVKETGDFAILDVTAPYMDGGSGSIYEHLVNGINAVLHRNGPHNLPLIKFGDWNDALSNIGKEGKGESVWLAEFFYFVLGEAIDLFTAAGKMGKEIEGYRKERESLRDSVNTHAWNGDYFVRAFTDEGVILGDKDCEEGRIYINPQTWAVISEIADKERIDKSLNAADALLLTRKGYVLHTPAYSSKTKLNLGALSQFEPGTKENGSVFSHGNAFAVIAKAKYGRGKDAYALYRSFSPFSRSAAEIEQAKIEPYVFCQYINGPEAERPGEGWFPWTTGTAGWSFRSVTDWIIGVRAEYNGLRIDPCINPDWNQFQIKRSFRGAVYNITVSNPDHVEKGVKKITVDGKMIGTAVIPITQGKQSYNVQVLMGCPESR
jgi:cellobiose phosphorylase